MYLVGITSKNKMKLRVQTAEVGLGESHLRHGWKRLFQIGFGTSKTLTDDFISKVIPALTPKPIRQLTHVFYRCARQPASSARWTRRRRGSRSWGRSWALHAMRKSSWRSGIRPSSMTTAKLLANSNVQNVKSASSMNSLTQWVPSQQLSWRPDDRYNASQFSFNEWLTFTSFVNRNVNYKLFK